MNIEKRIELALKISEGIENGKISPNNLYDLLLHLSEAMSQVKNLTIPVVSHQRELLSQYNSFVNMQYNGVSLDDADIDDFKDWLNCG